MPTFFIDPNPHRAVEIAARVGLANSIEHNHWIEVFRFDAEDFLSNLLPLFFLDAQNGLIDRRRSIRRLDGLEFVIRVEAFRERM